jgi:hypothetical protein
MDRSICQSLENPQASLKSLLSASDLHLCGRDKRSCLKRFYKNRMGEETRIGNTVKGTEPKDRKQTSCKQMVDNQWPILLQQYWLRFRDGLRWQRIEHNLQRMALGSTMYGNDLGSYWTCKNSRCRWANFFSQHLPCLHLLTFINDDPGMDAIIGSQIIRKPTQRKFGDSLAFRMPSYRDIEPTRDL